MSGAFGWRNSLAYGLMGLPLAFAALPLSVLLPNHYARQFGVPLAALGLLSPPIAGAAMAASSVSVLTNALLLSRWRPRS